MSPAAAAKRQEKQNNDWFVYFSQFKILKPWQKESALIIELAFHCLYQIGLRFHSLFPADRLSCGNSFSVLITRLLTELYFSSPNSAPILVSFSPLCVSLPDILRGFWARLPAPFCFALKQRRLFYRPCKIRQYAET